MAVDSLQNVGMYNQQSGIQPVTDPTSVIGVVCVQIHGRSNLIYHHCIQDLNTGVIGHPSLLWPDYYGY